MKFFICKGPCGETHSVPDDHKTPNYCPPCRALSIKRSSKANSARQAAKRKAIRASVTGKLAGRDWAKAVNDLSICSRQGTAAMLGVSEEQIRVDEMSIVRKIRAACSGLAREAGYQFQSVHALRLHSPGPCAKQASVRRSRPIHPVPRAPASFTVDTESTIGNPKVT